MNQNNIVEKAKQFAFTKHNQPTGEQRYGSLPYSVHLQAVKDVADKYLYYLPITHHLIVQSAALLHDVVEDTDVSESQLERQFGPEIADIVYRVTNERGRDRKERNFKTYPKIWKSDLAIFVKLADRIANTTNSKNSNDKKGVEMYAKYTSEYPIFRYALRVKGLYPDMWEELDLLNEYIDCSECEYKK